jgi:hypothetical protein
VRFFFTDRNGEINDVGADQFELDESGALIFTADMDEPKLVLVVAPGDWHDLSSEDDA